jgi:hypothetical protein
MVGNGDEESTDDVRAGSDAVDGTEGAAAGGDGLPSDGSGDDGLLSPRTRILLDDRFGPVLGLLLLLALTGGLLTYATHIEPGTHVEERTVSTWESTAEWSHAARVTDPNPVFTQGTSLSDRSLYFTSVSPRLEGTFGYGYTASRGGDLSVDLTTTLVVRSVGERDGQRVTYWRVSEPLGQPQSASLAAGETTRASFETNVSGLQQRIERIRSDLGGSPGEAQARLLTRVRATGTVNGQSVRRFGEYAATIELDEGTFRVTDTGTERRSVNTTREVTVTNSYGPVRRVGAPLLLLVGLVGLVGLIVGRERGSLDVSTAMRERLAFEADRREFDDWITTGSVDADPGDRSTVAVDSLEGLVDVAIDTENRVLEDGATDRFLVLTGDTVYRFDAPPDPRTVEGTVDGVVDGESGGDGDGEDGDG